MTRPWEMPASYDAWRTEYPPEWDEVDYGCLESHREWAKSEANRLYMSGKYEPKVGDLDFDLCPDADSLEDHEALVLVCEEMDEMCKVKK